MVITGRSTTTPTKLTVPAAGAWTSAPAPAVPRSTPRCPLSHGFGGGSNPRRTAGRGASGHCHEARAPGRPAVAGTPAWPGTAAWAAVLVVAGASGVPETAEATD